MQFVSIKTEEDWKKVYKELSSFSTDAESWHPQLPLFMIFDVNEVNGHMRVSYTFLSKKQLTSMLETLE